MVTILPPDKWDLIIDFLAPDVASPSLHYATLRATALTCQAWLPRARFRLYKHVELDGLESIALFARTLTQSPDLQALVHRLHFWFDVGEFEAAPAEIPFPTSLIPTLSALHGLLFSYSSDGQDHLAMIQHRFREEWVIHKNLRTLRLDDVDITLEDLTRCVWSFPLLEELTLFRTYWCEGGAKPDSHGYRDHCQNLRKVMLDDVTLVKEILPALGTSIQDLSLSPTWNFPHLEESYEAIAALQGLRHLQLLFEEEPEEEDQDAYTWMMSVISQISPQARIEELVLYLVHIGSGEDTQTLELFAKGGFDEVLTRKPFDSLRRVEIVASGDSDKPERSMWLLWAARTTLPRFAERGTIKVVIQHMLA
ncbi:hypothetical protein C8Q74DRAFT_1452793 [Fomes fomentarius]|nr:hypothetical protein C8Q74DRAFT_1452793 [Fomes fomentarius]